MRTYTPVLLLLCMLLSAGCGSREINEQAVSEAVSTLLKEQSAAWNRGNIEGYMAGYWKSEDLSFTSGGTVSRGWQAVLERYERIYDTPDKMGHLEFTIHQVTPLAYDAAYVIGSWALTREPDNPDGKFTLIFRKLPEGWKIVHDHTSSSEK